jgi:hypothetical protein
MDLSIACHLLATRATMGEPGRPFPRSWALASLRVHRHQRMTGRLSDKDAIGSVDVAP